MPAPDRPGWWWWRLRGDAYEIVTDSGQINKCWHNWHPVKVCRLGDPDGLYVLGWEIAFQETGIHEAPTVEAYGGGWGPRIEEPEEPQDAQ